MITFENVSKIYDNGYGALKGVSFHIAKGEFVFLVGSSAAGKSTIIKLMMKEESATGGSIFINDIDVNALRHREIPYFRRTLGVVFQDFRLINTMTVYDNVAFSMRVIGKKKKEINRTVMNVLRVLDLQGKANRYPLELSGGEQQRVGLARALVNKPALIIADEPTGNVDPQMSHDIVEMLTQINEKGTTVLMVTHEHELVHQFNHRVITLEKGHIVSDTGAPMRPATVSLGSLAAEAGGESV